MNIISVSKEKREAVVLLNSTELVALCNALYRVTKDDKPNVTAHQLCADLIIASDLSRYGNLDGFSMERIMHHREKAKGGCNAKGD